MNLSFLPRFLVLCIRTIFCSSYVKIVAQPNCGPKDGQFIDQLSHASESSFLAKLMVLNITYLAKPHYQTKDAQVAKYCYTSMNLRFCLDS